MIILLNVPSAMSYSISGWKRSLIPPQPATTAQIDTSIPFFNMTNGESVNKIDLFVKDRRTNLPTNRRVLGFTTDKVNTMGDFLFSFITRSWNTL